MRYVKVSYPSLVIMIILQSQFFLKSTSIIFVIQLRFSRYNMNNGTGYMRITAAIFQFFGIAAAYLVAAQLL